MVAPARALDVRRRPTIKGRAVVGRTLRVTRGRWSPAADRITVRWIVGGATAGRNARLALRPRHAGETVRVVVRATSAGTRPARVSLRLPGRVRTK